MKTVIVLHTFLWWYHWYNTHNNNKTEQYSIIQVKTKSGKTISKRNYVDYLGYRQNKFDYLGYKQHKLFISLWKTHWLFRVYRKTDWLFGVWSNNILTNGGEWILFIKFSLHIPGIFLPNYLGLGMLALKTVVILHIFCEITPKNCYENIKYATQ